MLWIGDSGVAGESSFTVFMTDYSTYAGLFTCQRLAFAHRQSATILSRTKDLDKIYIDKVYNKLYYNPSNSNLYQCNTEWG